MKNFISYISFLLILVIVCLEITLRIFGLAAKTMPTENIDGNSMFEAGKTGYWIRGGLKEINSFYSINRQGYNSIIDFDDLVESDLNIALIGDSYIQGFHTDVKYSIGRQLEKILGPNVTVHEYGRAGANIVDYALVYKKYVEPKNYDYTFVLATDKDVQLYKASFIGKGDKIPKKNISRTIYDNVHILRYFNINHGLGIHVNNLIKNGPESIDRIHGKENNEDNIPKDVYIKEVNVKALNMLPNKVVFLYEKDRLNPLFIDNFDFEFKEVVHIKKPTNHGLDEHWNINGRYNCAKTMADYINEHKNKAKKVNENKNLN